MPSKKIVAARNAASKSAVNKTAPVARKAAAKVAQPSAAATFRLRIDLANLAVGAKTVKQLTRVVNKLAQTLTKMEDAGSVSLEVPVTGKIASLVTQDAKAARRFGMEQGRAPRGAKTAAPAAKKPAITAEAPAAAKKGPAKKAAAKKGTAEAAPVEAAETSGAKAPAAKNGAATKVAAKKAPAKKGAAKAAPVEAAETSGAKAPAAKSGAATKVAAKKAPRKTATNDVAESRNVAAPAEPAATKALAAESQGL